jgi:group I intron endonuclease
MIGIYGIKNKINDKIYVGQSIKIENRRSRHMSELKKHKHPNKHLCDSYKKYGKECFEFLILEECRKEELNIKEEKWINNFPKNKLYNKNFYITDLAGDKNPFFRKKHKLESKKKMSNWKKENYLGEKNPNFGKRWTNEQKKINVLKNSKTKLKEKDVIEIKNLLLEGNLKDKEIASKFGVNRTVITRISNGKRWTTITGGAIISNERRGLKNIGKKMSEEQKEKIRKALTGLKRSEETRKKISISKRRKI